MTFTLPTTCDTAHVIVEPGVRSFPGVEAVEFAALMFPPVAHRRGLVGVDEQTPRLWHDGRRQLVAGDRANDLVHRLVIAPGVVQVATNRLGAGEPGPGQQNQAQVERNRAEALGFDHVDDAMTYRDRGTIRGFSASARSNMLRTIALLDWSALVGIPAMITLTYPGDWRAVCPDGPTAKRHLDSFLKRWRRRWGRPQGIWKLEFQRRGAPHFHAYLGRPADVPLSEFREWVAAAWTEIVGAVGEERARHRKAGTGVDQQGSGWEASRAVDVRRLSVYFAKHNAKGVGHYQHTVPDDFPGVGRFWGKMGLELAVREVELTTDDFIELRRILARLRQSRFRGASRRVQKVDGNTGEVFYRWEPQRLETTVLGSGVVSTWVPARYKAKVPGRLNGTWVLIPDGPEVASALGRWLDTKKPRAA